MQADTLINSSFSPSPIEAGTVVVKPKRGRKPNKLVSSTDEASSKDITEVEAEAEVGDVNIIKQIAKKRGRKPKGGKIVQQSSSVEIASQPKPNIILHLKKCNMSDLLAQEPHESSQLESFNFSSRKHDLAYDLLEPLEEEEIPSIPAYNNVIAPVRTHAPTLIDDGYAKQVQKETWRKIKTLECNLHANFVENSKSCCFWDTHEFDTAPVFIPKHHVKDSYNVYGCFCSPECAVAYLMQESIDSSSKFERYHLLNHLYGKPNNYARQIKPAPNPHYMLERFCGNLTIQEYRSLLKKDRLFLILDKPLTRILPELHEDNDDFILNNKVIPSNSTQPKKKAQIKSQPLDHFGVLD